MTDPHPRNPGTDLSPAWFEDITVNTPATLARAENLVTRRSLNGAWRAAWLVNAIRCMDLTTLAGDDTEARVARLCAKARRPLAEPVLEALGLDHLTTGAVCVYPTMVRSAVKALDGTGIPVASVATGFPTGLMPLSLRLAEIRHALDEGAAEIDIVITRAHVLRADWAALYEEIAAMRAACGPAHMKVILATGELQTLSNVYRASMVAMQAGADFIKTSTGKEAVNATLPVSLTMVRAARDYGARTGVKIGFKPAGGMKTAADALCWQVLMKEEMGNDWLRPTLFRFGASSMLADIERALETHVTGRPAASHRLALA